jgi:hypothetical protein
MRALDDLGDVSFGSAALFAVQAHHHPVTVHNPAHLAAVQINIVDVFVIRDHKTVAIGMGMDSPSHEILAIGKAVVVFFETDQPARAAEVPQSIDDALELFRRKAASPLYLRRCQSQPGLLCEET